MMNTLSNLGYSKSGYHYQYPPTKLMNLKSLTGILDGIGRAGFKLIAGYILAIARPSCTGGDEKICKSISSNSKPEFVRYSPPWLLPFYTITK